MRPLAVVLALLLAWSALAQAPTGDVQITWQASTFATGYKLHTSWADQSDITDVGDVTVFVVPHGTLPRDCSAAVNVAVSAYSGAGESIPSPPVSFYPRPEVTSLAPSGTPPVWLVAGGSFAPGVTLLINGAPVGSLVRDSCSQLSFQAVGVPDAAEWTDVSACNGPICSSYLPIPEAPGVPGVS